MAMSGKVVAIIQARMGSSRLPGKVLALIEGRPVLWHIVHRLQRTGSLDGVVVAMPDGPRDEPIREFARTLRVPAVAGSGLDLIDRLCRTGEACGAEAIVRVTADCPLVDP